MVDKCCVLLKSNATERQLFDVLARPHFASLIAPATHAWLRTFLADAETVPITERIARVPRSHRRQVSRARHNGHADLIVSGDADLLALDPFRGIPIMPPAMFVRRATS
jgi:hypothetical protein